MRRVPLLLVCVLALAVGGCGGARGGGGSPKNAFVARADRICASHLKAVMSLLNQPGTGAAWQQQAAQDEGIYEIMDLSIQRLDALGAAPDPHSTAFARYVRTLKARAGLYRLTSVAFLNRDTLSALRFENRIRDIDAQGDRYAHSYGLRICGTDLHDLANAFSAAGWSPR
jgi:hypothetical protein